MGKLRDMVSDVRRKWDVYTGMLNRNVEQEGWRINGFNKAIVAIRSRGMSGFSGCGKNVCTQVRDLFLGFFFLFFFFLLE